MPESNTRRPAGGVMVTQVIPHRGLGGMQEIARLLQAHLPGHGVPVETVALSDLTGGASGAGRVARLLLGWASLVRGWRREARPVVLAHSVLAAVFVLSAARMAGVRARLLVLHTNRHTLGRAKTAIAWALVHSGVVTTVVYCGRTAGLGYDRLPGGMAGRGVVIQNGVDLTAIAAARRGGTPLGSDAGEPTLVTTARLVPGKNLPVLIDAMARLDVPARLVVCGDGEERGDLEALAAERGAPVEFAGRLAQADMFSRYADCAAYLAPSLDEGLPLGLIEAAAAGLPIVAADRPFNREVLGEGGHYVDATQVSAWVAAIRDVLADPAATAELARRGAEMVPHFDADRMAADYADLVTTTAGGRA